MKVCVVGSGIGGISAAYHLVQAGHKVTLIEKELQIGGHTYSIEIDGEKVDIGFMMFGDSNPNIKAWFKKFGLTKEDGTTEKRIPMSLSVVSDVPGDLQFSSRRPFTCFGDILNFSLWRILYDIFKFTMDLMEMPIKSKQTTRAWRLEGRYSHEFFRHYYLPFVAILWTIPKKDVLCLPACQFLRCLKSHAHSLYIPFWQVILGALGMRTEGPKQRWWFTGSSYLKRFVEYFESKNGVIRTGSAVKAVLKDGKGVELENGEQLSCDHVVLATHPEQTAELLRFCAPQAANELCKYNFHQSMIYVHRDPSFLPAKRNTWASWNVRITKNDEYILTYWMNRIQRLKSSKDVFVTITPLHFSEKVPEKNAILHQFRWDHPRLLTDCLPENEIIDINGVSLSGAWLGRGFHEDGFVAGRRAAAIVEDPKHKKIALYEDEANIPVPEVTPYRFPLWLSLLFGAIGVLVVLLLFSLVYLVI